MRQVGNCHPGAGHFVTAASTVAVKALVPLILPVWLLQPKSAGPEGHCDSAPPSCHRPSCAGELAGLRQQVTATEEKAALDKELMAQKLVQAEREAQASLREQRAAHEEDLQRLQREKVRSAGE